METQPDKPRVLIFSLRNIFGKALNRGPHFEFEDIICETDSVELVAPRPVGRAKYDPRSTAIGRSEGTAVSLV